MPGIGGNTLSPFYSSLLLRPAGSNNTFQTLPSSASASDWYVPFCRATPRRKRGLPDVTHSWYPISRGYRQTQITMDILVNLLVNPDKGMMPESGLPVSNSYSGYQCWLTLGASSDYPGGDTGIQYYYWIPSCFVEEIPHTISLLDDPVQPIRADLMIKANGPAFFLPDDTAAIASFCTYIQKLNWTF